MDGFDAFKHASSLSLALSARESAPTPTEMHPTTADPFFSYGSIADCRNGLSRYSRDLRCPGPEKKLVPQPTTCIQPPRSVGLARGGVDPEPLDTILHRETLPCRQTQRFQ